MSTDSLLYPGNLVLGVDGFRAAYELAGDGCCPDPLCLSFCSTVCAFVDILPSGPMWDHDKAEVLNQYQTNPEYNFCVIPDCIEIEPCRSMVTYSIYGARLLHDMVSNILWPSIREANPATVVSTLDDWLDRMGWEDCYRQYCRPIYMAELSPYLFDDGCGPAFCEAPYSNDFECALKHAILQSLTRASRGIIKNLDGINWVIAPLGAVLRPRTPYPGYVQDYLDGDCALAPDEGPPCYCQEVTLEICNVGETLPRCPEVGDQCGKVNRTIPARQRYACGEVELMIYPAVIAAECIVRSILTKKCPNIIFRCTGIIEPQP